MKKILLVANYQPDRQFSMLGFGEVLQAQLPASDLAVTTARPEAKFGAKVPQSSRWQKWFAYLDKLVVFPQQLSKMARNYDIVHVLDQGNGAYVPKVKGKATCVLTCHDLLAYMASQGLIQNWSVSRTGQKLQEMNWSGMRLADRIPCVSQATLDDCQNHLGISPEKLSLVYNGFYRPTLGEKQEAFASLVGRFPGLNGNYLMNIGVNVPYKNRPQAIKVFGELLRSQAIPGLKLAMVGAALTPEMWELAEGFRDEIIEIVSPGDQEVAELYRHSQGLLWTSRYEGFGLPVLEAMAYGSPVFTTNRKPMTEVAGEAGFLIDDEDAAKAAAEVAQAWPGRHSRQEAAAKQVAFFSTERMIEGYRALYRSL